MAGKPSVTRVVRYLRGAVSYYITASVTSLPANADGTVRNGDQDVTVSAYKRVGGNDPENNDTYYLRMYTVKDTVEEQFGPDTMKTNFGFLASVADGMDAVVAKLVSASGDVVSTLTIPVVLDGYDAINVVVSNENVVFTKVGQINKVYVDVYKGLVQMSYDGTDFGCSSLGVDGDGNKRLFDGHVAWAWFTDSDGRFYYAFKLRDKADLSESLEFTVTVNEVQYKRNIYFSTAFDGDKGDRGPALRGPQAWSDCAVGYSFQSGADGEEYKDVVLYNGNYYSCATSHTKTASNCPLSDEDTANGYWKLADKFELVATKILLATYALVENLGVEAIDMKDSSGNILFQAKDGNVTCNTGTFENVTVSNAVMSKVKVTGSIRNPFTSASGSFDTDYSDNVVLISSGGGWVDLYSLPWNCSQSGRRLTLVNYRWDSSYAYGSASLNAPTGMYFFENGISKSELKLSREIVTLLGYGDDSNFYGWIVLRRSDIMTTKRYGREIKVLAVGRVTGTSKGATISYKTFDGTAMSVSRSATGRYVVSFSTAWLSDADSCFPMLTGAGSGLMKATLYDKTYSSFTVDVSDDSSANDGNFSFMLMNYDDWQ